jgi:hypothetical protein
MLFDVDFRLLQTDGVGGRQVEQREDLATGGAVIKCPSPLNVLKDIYDHSCYWARSDEYQHLMTDLPWATKTPVKYALKRISQPKVP